MPNHIVMSRAPMIVPIMKIYNFPSIRSREGSPGGGSSSGSDIGARRRKKAAPGSGDENGADKSPAAAASAAVEDSDGSEKDMQIVETEEGDKEKVDEGDIFGDDLSISSEDDDEDKKKLEEEEDDNDSGEAQKKKKSRVLDDDDDEDNVQRYDDDADMKSGSDDDSDKDKKKKAEEKKEEAAAAAAAEEEEPVPETRIDVEVPKITTDLGKEIHFVKLPNFLSVDPRPFDPETYEDEIEDEDSLDEEGRARLKLKVENTIRWRQSFDAEGKSVRESNARVVRWSDGSMSLHLGNEIFDVYKQPLQGDFNHLFIRQGTGLQGQAVFRTKLSFRPHSTESFTHQKLTRNMADRTNKAAGIKVISQVGRDPEINRYKRVKEEEERLRAAMRRDSKQKRIRDTATRRGISSG